MHGAGEREVVTGFTQDQATQWLLFMVQKELLVTSKECPRELWLLDTV